MMASNPLISPLFLVGIVLMGGPWLWLSPAAPDSCGKLGLSRGACDVWGGGQPSKIWVIPRKREKETIKPNNQTNKHAKQRNKASTQIKNQRKKHTHMKPENHLQGKIDIIFPNCPSFILFSFKRGRLTPLKVGFRWTFITPCDSNVSG